MLNSATDMKKISLEEAQANFDHYLNEVAVGDEFEITVNGESVAQLLPFKETAGPEDAR